MKNDVTTEQKIDMIKAIIDQMKADRIEVLDVRTKTPVTDFFIICSGTSQTHANAISDKVADTLRQDGIKPLRKSAGERDGWILLDYGDVVLHVMLEDKRQFYDLETLWETMPPNPNLVE